MTLSIKEDRATASFDSAAAYTSLNQWVYCAAVYIEQAQPGSPQSTLLRRVRFYRGDLTHPVELINETTLQTPRPRPQFRYPGDVLAIGAERLLTGPLNGQIDNFRIYASPIDLGPALGPAMLEGLRQRDIGQPVSIGSTLLVHRLADSYFVLS